MSMKNTRKKNFVMGMEKAFTILRFPLVTEKSTSLSQYGQYGFVTALSATKADIKFAVEKIFKVEVLSVTTMIQKGKIKRFRGRLGVESNFKKAYVRLKSGHTLDIGAGV